MALQKERESLSAVFGIDLTVMGCVCVCVCVCMQSLEAWLQEEQNCEAS